MAEETKIIRIVIDSSKAVDGSAAATRALERMEKAQGQAASSLDRMEKAMGRVGGYMKAQLAIMAADLAARFVQIGKAAFDAASGMGELADQLGITTRGLQALQYSAVQNGVQLTQLETGVSKFSQKIGEAAGGSKEMVEALNLMGVKILDLNGQLRPTETLMQEVAASILAIDDPAKRSAASVDFFGKAGTKFLPVLQDMAKGLDAMGNAAERGGAMISERAIVRLDQLGDAAARSGLKMRAAFANGMVEILDEIEARLAKINIGFSDADFEKGAAARKRWLEGISDFGNGLRSALDEAALAGGRFVVTFMSYFENLPRDLPKLFVDALNGAIAAVESGLNEIGSKIAAEFPWLAGKAGISGTAVQFGRIGGGGASTASDRFSAANKAGDDWEAGKRAEFADYYARQNADRDRAALIARQAGFEGDEGVARRGRLGAVDGGGRSNPAVKGSGKDAEDAQKKYEKLQDQLELTAKAQDQMTAAARNGDVAFEEQRATLEAQQKILDIFGVTVGRGNEKLEKLRDLLLDISRGKAAEAFNVATTELEKQNEVLAAQNRLMGQAPELIAQEIAMIRVRQDVEKAGGKLSQEEIDRRYKAVEAGELLKAQGEELKRANELWTEPLKSALSSIQSASADMWEKILENGKFSMEEFGQLFIKTARRAAAELLSLATIRPVIGMGVELLGSAGLVSPATARDLGYGSTGMSGIGGSMSGSMSGSMGWFGNTFSGVGDWLKQPIGSLFSGAAPAGGYADIGALLASGNTGASAAASGIGGLGGISIGQGLGALGGIGMGAYQLFNSRSTGQTLGGIGSMIGGAVSLIPGVGQIAGPLIALASAFLPSLFGEGDTRTHSSTNASLRYGGGNWYTTGGAYGAGANSGAGESALRGTTAGIDAIFNMMGGVKDPSKVWGFDTSSWTAQGKDWSYTSNATHLVDPATGMQEAWRMNTDNMMDTGAAQVAIRSMLSGAVGELSATLKTVLEKIGEPTLKEVADNVSLAEAYDKLGKRSTEAADALKAVDAQFKPLIDFAERFGLAMEPVNERVLADKLRIYEDFAGQFGTAASQALTASTRQLETMRETFATFAEHASEMGLTAEKVAADLAAAENKIRTEQQRQYGSYVAGFGSEDARNTLAYEASVRELGETMTGFLENAAQLGISVEQIRADYEAAYAKLASARQRQSTFKAEFFGGFETERLQRTDPMGAQIAEWRREIGSVLGTAADQWGMSSTEYYDASVAAFARFNDKMKAANDDFVSTMNEMLRDDPFGAQIDALMKQRDAAMTAAAALDKTGALVERASLAFAKPIAKLGDELSQSISDQLMEMDDPLGYQRTLLERAQAADTKKAEQVNAALAAIYGPISEAISARSNKFDAAGNAYTVISDADRALLAEISGGYVDTLKLQELYTRKRLKLEQDYYAQSLGSLEDVIKRLTYGDLSGVSGAATLSGTRGAYEAVLAQARAGDQLALQNLGGAAQDYVTAGRNQYSETAEFFRIRQEVLAALREIDAAQRSGSTTTTTTPTPSNTDIALQANTTATQQAMDTLVRENAELKASIERLIELMQRKLAA